ncbi:ogr/Delta-like zinc finger family protein [Rosenbergiella nectarea]|uniref:ogr/Delta-like zinc finger family protein n=1 Tax=Rosenbergiella nectarea TaxID=988801 RepID=UPI001F4E7C2D|nr:ogr/Delta-like zinc finger family protein [Rosenbergiella nectarea]
MFELVKERYHQCTNLDCSCSFKTSESITRVITTPPQPEICEAQSSPLPQAIPRRWAATEVPSDIDPKPHSLPALRRGFFCGKLKIFCTETSIKSDACKSCMVLYAQDACQNYQQGQYWRGRSPCIQLHEKRCIKRAGVVGVALLR